MSHSATTSLTASIRHLVATVWRVFKNRRQVVTLSTLSDSQLKDIGLTRGDVRRALQLPLYSDPSHVLKVWVAQHYLSARSTSTGDFLPTLATVKQPERICSTSNESKLAA